MSLAVVSLGALLIAIAVSCVSEVNVGFLAIAFAWIVGVYIAGMPLGQVMAGFPAQLFLTLVGVTLLFGAAHTNGTLDRIAQHAVRLCRGNRGMIPIMFFGLALVLSSIGPGNITSAALVAPLAMGVAGKAGLSAFLMALMVGNGASAGSLSPFAPAGIVANEVMARAGMTDVAAQNYFNNVIAHTAVAFVGYFLFGGWRLFRRRSTDQPVPTAPGADAASASVIEPPAPFEASHVITSVVMATLIGSVILFDVNVGMGAFVGAILLTLLKVADEKRAIAQMPWRVILMVSGVTLLIAVLEKNGGIELFATMLARLSTPETVIGITAFSTGIISIYSSTSGVVLPALLPTVPSLVEQLGGGDPLAIASSINVGAHLVDLSPLSTIGAICVACAPDTEDSRALFNKLMAWGVSMSIVGALLCWVFFGLLRVP